MDDFEYSVQICDRDWECFFEECEECNLLPPALAGLDDSGMSDMDDLGSILANRVQRVERTAGCLEADRPFDGPPDCEGSPVEHYLSKYGVAGMESVLSGSEEDIHLESVNTFFERLKSLTEVENLTEPSQVGVGKNREAAQGEELCSDGPQASSSALPKNIPKLNSLPARSETAIGKETAKTVNANSNINTMKKDEPDSKISPGLAASKSLFETNKSELFIRGEDWVETTANEVRKQSQSHESPDVVVCSGTTPDSDKVRSSDMDMCKLWDDVNQGDLLVGQAALNRSPKTESPCNLQVMAEVKLEKDKNLYVPIVLLPDRDPKSPNKGASQELSPSPSVKKKRRRKKRISLEPTESVLSGYERQFLANQSDSEEELCAWRRGMDACLSGDNNLSYMTKTEKTDCSMAPLTTYSATSNLPLKITAVENKVNRLSPSTPPSHSLYQDLPEGLVRHERCKSPDSPENNTTNDRSAPPPGQTDDSVVSTLSNGGNVATHLQPCSKLQLQESTGLKKCLGLSVSITACATGKSDLATEIENYDRLSLSTCERHAGSFQQSDKMNHSLLSCENETSPKSCTAEVISVTHSILLSSESDYAALEASQNDEVSTTKSSLAVEAGNTERDAEPPQQLEVATKFEKTNSPLSSFVMSGSDVQELPAHKTKPQQIKTRSCSSCDENPPQVASATLTLETSNSSPDKGRWSKSPSNLDIDNTIQQAKHSQEVEALSKLDVLSEKNRITERTGVVVPHVTVVHSENPLQSSEMKYTGNSQRENNPNLSMSDNLLSDIPSILSCSTILSSSVVLATDEEGEGISGPKSLLQHDTTELKCDLEAGTEDAATTSEAETNEAAKAPDCKRSVYAMSSFWTEMEKLTIKDILGLRMASSSAPSSLPALPESEAADTSDAADSGYFAQLDESKPDHSGEDTSSLPRFVESNSVLAIDSSSSAGVKWENELDPLSLGAGVYPENMMLTSVSDIPQPLLSSSSSSSAQKYLRKMSKNASVHNLHALDSEPFSHTWKGQALLTAIPEEGELDSEYFTDGHMPRKDSGIDSLPSSSFTGNASTDSYRISLTDIFQYFFRGKPSNPSPSVTDNIATYYTDGNSVPETYDHFFSEFDTGSFFYPLIRTTDQAKDELVPIFSCSRSTSRNLQFPEAYDHFFASSSSDDSSVESDEEADDEDRGPIRVVTRFSREANATQISTDVYEDFFTDGDLGQNLFWKNTFSLRNIRLTGSASQQQRSSSLSVVPVRQSGRSLPGTIQPISALGNQDVPIPDPLLYHLEDRISRQLQLAQQPFRYEDLQTAASNPRLDASLVPLRQSDMCLVCIAFASWVLKSANPQVGDAWKAVLLANVSALSAIRYLRKYVRVEAAAEEKALHHTASV